MHDELRLLFDQDQADRHGDLPPDLYARDLVRRRRLEQLIADGALQDHHDYLHAAFLFQHGDRLEHYWQAYELATTAVELGGDATARWLSAAAYDRWLTQQGKPQKYGTQYRAEAGVWRLAPVDPTTTDEERAQVNVPPLAEAVRRAEQLTQERPPGMGVAWRERLDAPVTMDGPVLASLRVARLQVLVQAIEPTEHSEPEPVPLSLDEVPRDRPTALDPAWTLCRYAVGYSAVQSDGTVACFWYAVPLGPDDIFTVPWNTAWGPVPQLHAAQIGASVGIVIEPAAPFPTVVVSARDGGSAWVLGGRLTRPELERMAGTLPA